MDECRSLTSSQYYEYRKKIRELYKNDVNNNGDLCSSVLQIRDKNKRINSIGVAIQDYKIDVEVDENTPISKIINIKDKIANSVGRYIVDNKDRLDIDTNSESFNQFLESENHLFCDIAVVGNSIKFNL